MKIHGATVSGEPGSFVTHDGNQTTNTQVLSFYFPPDTVDC